jgi:hypothetical protein
MDFWKNNKISLMLLLRYKFSYLVLYYFDCYFFIFLSSLKKIKYPIASAKYFMFFILRGSILGYFFLYLRYISIYFSRLDFVILATYVFQISIIAVYCGLLLGASFL